VGIDGGIAKCGVCVAGLSRYIGDLQYKPATRVKSWSDKTRDTWGGVSLIKRVPSKTVTCQLVVRNEDIDEIYKIVEQYESVPLIFVGSELFDITTVFGYYSDFNAVIDNPSHSICDMIVEGFV
jgi:hypothetical protein